MNSGQLHFLQSLGWAVINNLWQLALLWVIYQIITGVISNLKPSSKSFLAASLLVLGFAWFIFTFLSSLSNSIDQELLSSAFINPVSNQTFSNRLIAFLPVISIFYLIILLLPIFRFFKNYRYAQVLRHYGISKIDPEWRIFVKKFSSYFGITKPVKIWISEFVSSPVTIGFLKPVILVPLAAINNLTTQQIEAVLIHELSHIKRSDYLVNLIISFIKSILYFNPFATAFVCIVENEREKSCDEMVLQYQYNGHEYASALLTLEKLNQTNHVLILAALGKKFELLNRIELLTGIKKKQLFSFNKVAGFITSLLFIAIVNFLLTNQNITRNDLYSDNILVSPFGIITNNYQAAGEKIKLSSEYKNPISLAKETRQKDNIPKSIKPNQKKITKKETNNNIENNSTGFIYTNFNTPGAPLLDKVQEKKLKETLERSKIAIEKIQWKEIEKNIAEVCSQQEKENIKASYKNEFEKINWDQLENNLRIAYAKIDWERVNAVIENVTKRIQLDSLQRVYNGIYMDLLSIQKELIKHNQTSIPDTDFTNKTIEERKQLIQKTLNIIKAIRSNKIVVL